EIVDMLNSNGAVNAQGGAYEGLDRFEARKRIAKDLDAAGHLVKVEDYPHKVGRSERTKAVIEPKLSVQWFCDMKKMARTALDAVMNDHVQFHPAKFKNVYRHWMENVTDWCISRQLWWGQQIPAWHYGQGLKDYVVARTLEEALALAREKTGNATLQADGLRQDDDVVDTWFSSWLWPISVFDGFKNPGNPEIDYYYPTNTLVTGHDIIFFWVARMIMAGYEYKDEKPFSDVYFTGMVRDKERRKMSKQLGNSPDPLELIQQFGADGVRAGMLFSSPAGNDLLFDEQLCLQGRNFTNKIWNSFRLLQSWTIDESATPSDVSTISGQWLEARFQEVLEQLEDHYEKFRISDALMLTYKFIWDDYCSWYLELIKPDYQQPIDRTTYDQAIGFMEKMLQVLHPLMPFITEEIWQLIRDRKPEEALIVTPWPTKHSFDGQLLADFERSRSVIGKVRAIRRKRKIAPKDPIKLFVRVPRPIPMLESVIIKLGNLASIEWQEDKPRGVECFVVNATEYFISLEGKVDLEAEVAQLKEQLDYQRGFLEKVRQKLANERFVNNAPEQVVANERKKEADATAKIEVLESQLADLG
ncbi:MAG: class I tRNA ligase family protein, partial [Bacteroidota bacterium]